MCRIIFRIRQLHIIRWQMLVGHKKQIMKGNPAKYLGLHLPRPEETPPAPWWTNECDHSLVVGIFKHGTEEHCTSILSTVYTFIHRVVLSFGIESVHTWIMVCFPVLLAMPDSRNSVCCTVQFTYIFSFCSTFGIAVFFLG